MSYLELISVILFLAAIALVYIWEIIFLARFIRLKITHKNIKHNAVSIFTHIIAVIGIMCFFYGYFIEPYRVEVNEIEILTDKLQNTELKIVQVSDSHCDRKVINEYKMVEIINALEPDVVVFTGDSLNRIEGLERFRDVMGSLKAGLGKYAVFGNVDVIYFSRAGLFKNTGFEVLDKKSVKLAKGNEDFFISGLSFACPWEYANVLKNVPPDKYSIFLNHYPDLIEKVQGLGVDLYLAGHTHGGQIRLPFYGALVTFSKYGKKYEAGKYKVGDTILYVNRGIGLEGGTSPRVRFLSRPEITVFDIKPAK